MKGKVDPLLWVGLGLVGGVVALVLGVQVVQARNNRYAGQVMGAIAIVALAIGAVASQSQVRSQYEWPEEEEGPELEPVPLPPAPLPPLRPLEMVEIEPLWEPEPLKMMEFED